MWGFFDLFFHIFETSIIPLLILISGGYVLDRLFKLDLFTLSKLNFYILLPTYIFMFLYQSNFTMESVEIILCGITVLALGSISAGITGRLAGFSRGKTEIYRNSIMFNNCGNIGAAIVTFVYSNEPFLRDGVPAYLSDALLAVISLVVIQNLTSNTLGFYQAGQGKYTAWDCAKKVLRMPTIYLIPTVVFFRGFGIPLQDYPIWPALTFFSHAFVAMAMITLGAQINRTPLNFLKLDVMLATFMRLIAGPIFAAIAIFVFGHFYAPLPSIAAQGIVITYAVPSAINTALIALEMDNHPEFATQVVMATTLLSAITMPFVILAAYYIYPL